MEFCSEMRTSPINSTINAYSMAVVPASLAWSANSVRSGRRPYARRSMNQRNQRNRLITTTSKSVTINANSSVRLLLCPLDRVPCGE
jgi:hypothetical protein